MVTPVDFHTADNMLSNWTQGMDVDLFVDTLGNVPADLMNWCYLTLKPLRLFPQKYVGLVDILDDKTSGRGFPAHGEMDLRFARSGRRGVPPVHQAVLPGQRLRQGGIVIGDEEVHLGLIEMPVLNIFAEQDHLVPPASSKALKSLIGSDDYTELSFRGGHIGIYVSGRAQKEVPETIHSMVGAAFGRMIRIAPIVFGSVLWLSSSPPAAAAEPEGQAKSHG